MKNVGVWQLLDEVVSRELFQIIIWYTGYFRWLGLILTLDILARTFHHGDFSAQGHFGTIEISAHGRYDWDILA